MKLSVRYKFFNANIWRRNNDWAEYQNLAIISDVYVYTTGTSNTLIGFYRRKVPLATLQPYQSFFSKNPVLNQNGIGHTTDLVRVLQCLLCVVHISFSFSHTYTSYKLVSPTQAGGSSREVQVSNRTFSCSLFWAHFIFYIAAKRKSYAIFKRNKKKVIFSLFSLIMLSKTSKHFTQNCLWQQTKTI